MTCNRSVQDYEKRSIAHRSIEVTATTHGVIPDNRLVCQPIRADLAWPHDRRLRARTLRSTSTATLFARRPVVQDQVLNADVSREPRIPVPALDALELRLDGLA